MSFDSWLSAFADLARGTDLFLIALGSSKSFGVSSRVSGFSDFFTSFSSCTASLLLAIFSGLEPVRSSPTFIGLLSFDFSSFLCSNSLGVLIASG